MEEAKAYRAGVDEITINPQPRKKFSKKELKELADSIESVGQLQPGVCKLNSEGTPVLIIGERRYRACKMLQIPFIYHLKEDIADEAMQLEIQIMENLCRENLTWQEEAEAKMQLHELRQSQFGKTSSGTRGGHTMQATANELHQSRGIVSEDIKLAMWAREVPEIADAKNKTEAKKIVKRFESQISYSDALEKTLEPAKEKLSEKHGSSEKTSVEMDKDGGQPSILSSLETRLLEFDKRCLLGKMEEVLAEDLFEERFDIVLFDPPWGVEYDKVAQQTGDTQAFSDDVETFLKSFYHQIKVIYSQMSADSHLYLFFGIVWHNFVYDTLEAAGFETNRMPLVWHKIGAHRTRNPKVWPGRCYEPIAYARKGSKNLQQMGRPDIISTKPPTPKMKKEHPAAKHPDIYVDLLQRSAFPGDRVLDPMAGSGMAAVACEHLRATHNLDWTMIEKDEGFRDLQLMNLNQGYMDIVDPGAGLHEEEPLPEDFRQLKPGTLQWTQYWNKFPEKQEEMLQYRESLA